MFSENLLHAANDLVSMPSQVILNSSLAQDTFFAIRSEMETRLRERDRQRQTDRQTDRQRQTESELFVC